MDPGTMFLISQGVGLVSDFLQGQSESDANTQMMDTIEKTAGKFLDTSEDMFSVARYFQPGGGAFKDAEKTAISNAFTTARKGNEELLAKGVNMTSYGMGTAADIVKDTFTKNIMSDYKELSSIGQSYAGLGVDALKSYGDYMTTGAQASFMNTSAQSNPFGSLVDVFSDPESITAVQNLFA